MAKTETYASDGLGNTTLASSVNAEDPIATEGYAVLVPTAGGSRVTITTPLAGTSVPIITRIQDNTSAVGSVYIYDAATQDGVSFQIRSTDAQDAGTIYWRFTN